MSFFYKKREEMFCYDVEGYNKGYCFFTRKGKVEVENMANKELAEYIMEQLEGLEHIRNIPMMGGYIFYYNERIFGGIYESGFMVKITKASKRYMPDSEEECPYEGAKPMLPVTIVDDREKLKEMVKAMYPELPERKPKKKRN